MPGLRLNTAHSSTAFYKRNLLQRNEDGIFLKQPNATPDDLPKCFLTHFHADLPCLSDFPKQAVVFVGRWSLDSCGRKRNPIRYLSPGWVFGGNLTWHQISIRRIGPRMITPGILLFLGQFQIQKELKVESGWLREVIPTVDRSFKVEGQVRKHICWHRLIVMRGKFSTESRQPHCFHVAELQMVDWKWLPFYAAFSCSFLVKTILNVNISYSFIYFLQEDKSSRPKRLSKTCHSSLKGLYLLINNGFCWALNNWLKKYWQNEISR